MMVTRCWEGEESKDIFNVVKSHKVPAIRYIWSGLLMYIVMTMLTTLHPVRSDFPTDLKAKYTQELEQKYL